MGIKEFSKAEAILFSLEQIQKIRPKFPALEPTGFVLGLVDANIFLHSAKTKQKPILTARALFQKSVAVPLMRVFNRNVTRGTACIIADKTRTKRRIAIKHDESTRRRQRNVHLMADPYPEGLTFEPDGIVCDSKSGTREIDIGRLLVSQGSGAGDAWWSFVKRCLDVPPAPTINMIRESIRSRIEVRTVNTESVFGEIDYEEDEVMGVAPSSVDCPYSVECDVVEGRHECFGEADIGIIQRMLKTPEDGSQVIHIYTTDTDATVHAVYTTWDTARRVIIHPGWSMYARREGAEAAIDTQQMWMALKENGWTRDHFLAACIFSGCDFFKLEDGVCVGNIGTESFWKAQVRLLPLSVELDFPEPKSILQFIALICASHGGFKASEMRYNQQSVDELFAKGKATRALRKDGPTRCPILPIDTRKVITRFTDNWNYWLQSFTANPTPIFSEHD